ncbi:hypothetical protein BJ878DRAFT_539860 [Calycina marina]|uniref:FAD-binding domain-containing protein n=1 Tax=Calycina marina TaxID=1763456 RepID=A0A9P7Z7V5_9HELO|nr:hypothetical protein BJ878DRAFT_539860 [Calycina marina]
MGSEAYPLRVLIIGAGSAGLLTAQVGIACTVFEQDTGFFQRPRDWNYGIYWAQSRLDECLTPDLRALVKSVQTDPSYTPSADSIMPLHNGKTGELMRNIPAPYSLRLRRKRWLQLLSKNVDIKWGKRVTCFEVAGGSVTLTFTDGTRETGDLVVGAEGAHSPTREFLLGRDAELIPSRIVASVSIVTHSREAALAMRSLHQRYSLSFHPNNTFTWHSIHDCSSEDPAEWTWMVMQTWPTDEPTNLTTSEDVLNDMYERGKAFGPPFREAFLTIPKDTYVWHNRLSYWATKPWDSRNGLITLAGDAAHPMTFRESPPSSCIPVLTVVTREDRGQGLNNAITDAAELLVQLRAMKSHTHDELATAVKRYETDLWPRGNEAVLASLENTNAVHDWANVLQSPLFTAGLARTAKTDDIANGNALAAS